MLKPLRIFVPAGMSLLLVLSSGAALAQSNDVRGLADTVSRLERQLQALERSVYRGAPPPAVSQSSPSTASPSNAPSGTALSNLQVTTDGLEEQLRRLTGQIEQLDFQVRQMNQRMDRLVSDVDFRLQSLEQGAGATTRPSASQPIAPAVPRAPGAVTVEPGGGPGAPRVFGTLTETQLRAAGVETGPVGEQTASTDPVAPTPSPAALPAGSPRDQYDFAYKFLLQRDFESAETALSAFVAANPEDSLAGNAQYWLGETFYVRGDYPTAARAFAEGFQRYPDSAKAPDNLLKLGMSLAQLEQSADACITLKKLRVEYPDAPTSIVQRADREIGRLQCP